MAVACQWNKYYNKVYFADALSKGKMQRKCQNLGGHYTLASPNSKFWGTCPPPIPPMFTPLPMNQPVSSRLSMLTHSSAPAAHTHMSRANTTTAALNIARMPNIAHHRASWFAGCRRPWIDVWSDGKTIKLSLLSTKMYDEDINRIMELQLTTLMHRRETNFISFI